MEWRAFVASVVQALAWPAAVVIAVVLLRHSIRGLIPRLREVRVPGAEAVFDAAVEAVYKEVRGEVQGRAWSEGQRLLLLTLVFSLPHPDRRIIVGHYYDEVSDASLAKELEIPESEVRERQCAFLSMLKPLIKLYDG